jgi:N-glycosylase/DNA lyase
MLSQSIYTASSISRKKAILYVDETIIWKKVKEIVSHFPDENYEILPGIKWGNYTQLYTPAFWKLQYLLSNYSNNFNSHRLASTIQEEIVMCILGGYGIPSEMGIIAFNRLKQNGNIKYGVSFELIYNNLASPFCLSNGKSCYYRFYNQKSKYIHRFLNRNDINNIPVNDDMDLRSWLLTVDGIGLKTASWITRNWLKSNNVAILDIHLLRAGKLAGFFEFKSISSFNYLSLEKKYLEFCNALQVQASNMDAIIWYYMKKNTKLAIKTLIS